MALISGVDSNISNISDLSASLTHHSGDNGKQADCTNNRIVFHQLLDIAARSAMNTKNNNNRLWNLFSCTQLDETKGRRKCMATAFFLQLPWNFLRRRETRTLKQCHDAEENGMPRFKQLLK
uniref:Uncharacterized protein n=1 Tax=Ascaris lumbricoides TaxID=6252 RepID=A0A0M3IAB8_ASCLU